jgi:hypothetical protein
MISFLPLFLQSIYDSLAAFLALPAHSLFHLTSLDITCSTTAKISQTLENETSYTDDTNSSDPEADL